MWRYLKPPCWRFCVEKCEVQNSSIRCGAPLVRSRTPSTVDRSRTGAQRMRTGFDVARPSYFFPPWSYIFCVYLGCYRICLFSLRRILEDHPCLEILSVFSPGRRLNYILYRPQQFHDCHCSDGDSVRSTIVLTSYSAEYVLVLPAVR